MSNPFVRVVEGLPSEQQINETLTQALSGGARFVSMTAFGTDGETGRVILLFEGKPGGPKRVALDTSVIGQ